MWNQIKPAPDLLNITGRWIITNTVTKSNGGQFDGEVYRYNVGIHESPTHELGGDGEQDLYLYANGQPHKKLSRFLFLVTGGSNTDEGITMNFAIEGNRRFTGTMWLQANDQDPEHLTGTFRYTAGGTEGTTEVEIKHH